MTTTNPSRNDHRRETTNVGGTGTNEQELAPESAKVFDPGGPTLNPTVRSDSNHEINSDEERRRRCTVPEEVRNEQRTARCNYDFWGDKLEPLNEDEGAELIGFVNRGGFSIRRCKGGSKCPCSDCSVRSFIKAFNFGIFGQAETNVNWAAVPTQDRLQERTRTWFRKINRVTSHNVHGTPDAHQYGGGNAVDDRWYR